MRGARADVLDEHDSGWSTVPLWEELAFSSLAPGGARELVVELERRLEATKAEGEAKSAGGAK